MALEIGHPFPERLAKELTNRELNSWIAYYQLEPFGDKRRDLRIANHSRINHALAGMFGRRPPRLLKVEEYGLTIKKPTKQQTADEMKNIAMAWHNVISSNKKK